VVESCEVDRSTYQRSPHSGIFFVAADFQGSLSLTQSKFIRSFNGGAPLRASRTRIYFRGPPGGRSEVYEVEIRHRWPSARIFSQVSEEFFLEAGRGASDCLEALGRDRRPAFRRNVANLKMKSPRQHSSAAY
jgi:hypothetical protein